MDVTQIDAFLAPLTKQAYDAELTARWDEAYSLHERAESEWSQFAESSSPPTTDQFYKRFALKRSYLHRERLQILKPFAKDGQPVPDKMLLHPSSQLAFAGLTEFVPTDLVTSVGVGMEPTQALRLTMASAHI